MPILGALKTGHMKYFLSILLTAIAFSGCDYAEKELPEDDYLLFCLRVQEEYNSGEHRLSDFFDFEVFSDKIAGQIDKYSSRGAVKFSNSHVFARDVDGFNERTRRLIFNTLKKDKNGKNKAVFLVDINGYQDYYEMELLQSSHRIYIVDYYSYSAGAYMSELMGQSMAIANSYAASDHGKRLTANPRVIAEDLMSAIATNNIKWGWQRYDMLKSAEKEMRLFDFFKVQMAMLSADSVYIRVLDEMLLEKKRDPRFFYLHQFGKYTKLHDYTKALEQLTKLYEHTGKNIVEQLQLATFMALIGQYQESMEIAKVLKKDYPESHIGLIHQMVIYYFMEDKVKFEATLAQLQKVYELSGEQILTEIAGSYPLVPAERFENLGAWVDGSAATINK